MRAEVTGNTSRQEITIEVTGDVPDIDVTEEWQKHIRIMRPDKALLILIDGQRRRIEVSGPQVLKGGRLSPATRLKREWRGTGQAYLLKQRIESAPDWVRTLWTEAPGGLTVWPEGELG